MPMDEAASRAIERNFVGRDFSDDGTATGAGEEIAADFLSKADEDRALFVVEAEQQMIV